MDVVTARVGEQAGPGFTAALLRPDSYIAWATSAPAPDSSELAELRTAGGRWFGVE